MKLFLKKTVKTVVETSNDEDDRRDDCDAADAEHHVKLQLRQFHQPTRLNAENIDDGDRSLKRATPQMK